jgi:predicted transcriptional regulator
MNGSLLIDAIVRQTVVLIATLATGAGQRASLSHVADQVFSDLVGALKEQGLSNKLIADMFGMALRTYHSRVAQLSESRTDTGRSLWEAVYGHIQQRGPLLRSEVLTRFGRDDSAVVRSVLRDLCDSGLVYRSGRGDSTSYQARDVDAAAALGSNDQALLSRMLLVAVHRNGPITQNALAELLRADDAVALQSALSELCAQGLITEQTAQESVLYSCERCVIPFGDDHGWEAAVFDHYQAMVSALVTKLRSKRRSAALADQVGGSTFVFDLFEGHPLQSEVLGYLATTRTLGLSLRARIDAYAAQHPSPPGVRPLRVVAYVGQSVSESDEENADA